MDIKEFYVQDRLAIAITSMSLVGDDIYLGLTGSSYALAKFNTKTEKMELCTEVFPWLREKSYCTKIHNSMGVLSDKEILFGEGNHFTWDGLPVYSQYLKSELPEIMLKRKREQGYADITYNDFCLDSLADWDRERDDLGGKIVKYNVETDTIEVVAELPKYCYSQAMIVNPRQPDGL